MIVRRHFSKWKMLLIYVTKKGLHSVPCRIHEDLIFSLLQPHLGQAFLSSSFPRSQFFTHRAVVLSFVSFYGAGALKSSSSHIVQIGTKT